MAQRKLKVVNVGVTTTTLKPEGGGTGTGVEVTELRVVFSRKLTDLEVSGARAVLEGTIK